jgi:hypothetical protein
MMSTQKKYTDELMDEVIYKLAIFKLQVCTIYKLKIESKIDYIYLWS